MGNCHHGGSGRQEAMLKIPKDNSAAIKEWDES